MSHDTVHVTLIPHEIKDGTVKKNPAKFLLFQLTEKHPLKQISTRKKMLKFYNLIKVKKLLMVNVIYMQH